MGDVRELWYWNRASGEISSSGGKIEGTFLIHSVFGDFLGSS